jgi:uncharacterized membrane protein YdjX (TVP38/TMEM64 family)
MAKQAQGGWKDWLTWKTAAVLLIVAGLLAAGHFLPVAAWFGRLNGWIGSLGWAAPLIYIAIYVVGTVAFLPGSVLTSGAGVLFGLWGIPVVSVGATIGAALAFLVARYLAREKIARLAENNAKFRAIDKAVGEQGGKLVGLLRLSPVIPFNVSNYFYGLTTVKFWPYVLATWLGTLPGTCLYVYLGAAGKAGLGAGQRTHTPLEYVLLGVGLLATIVVTVIVTRIAKRALAKTDVAPA